MCLQYCICVSATNMQYASYSNIKLNTLNFDI